MMIPGYVTAALAKMRDFVYNQMIRKEVRKGE
jgi:hypothetical protein